MARLICLQAGHWNVTTGATGAPGEQELNYRIMMRLKDVLISKGFMLQLVDANPPSDQINKDFDLFLALHGDANVYGTGGGFVDHPEPSTDAATIESQRIDLAIESQYFNHSGIINHPERSNANTKYYYMWSRLSARTPCVIIEMGVVQDAHDKVILTDTDRVANAIARGICVAFNVQFDPITPPPVVPPVVPPPPPPVVCPPDYKPYLLQIKEAMVKGYFWIKLAKVKQIIIESGV